jgi:hypothetical protein
MSLPTSASAVIEDLLAVSTRLQVRPSSALRYSEPRSPAARIAPVPG